MHDPTRPGRSASTPVSCPKRARQWADFLEYVAQSIGSEQFNIWIRRGRCIELDDHRLELEYPNEHYTAFVNENFHSLLSEAARSVLGPDIKVLIKAPDSSCELRARSQESSTSLQSKPSAGAQKASSPVMPRPRINVWTSCVPS